MYRSKIHEGSWILGSHKTLTSTSNTSKIPLIFQKSWSFRGKMIASLANCRESWISECCFFGSLIATKNWRLLVIGTYKVGTRKPLINGRVPPCTWNSVLLLAFCDAWLKTMLTNTDRFRYPLLVKHLCAFPLVVHPPVWGRGESDVQVASATAASGSWPFFRRLPQNGTRSLVAQGSCGNFLEGLLKGKGGGHHKGLWPLLHQ